MALAMSCALMLTLRFISTMYLSMYMCVSNALLIVWLYIVAVYVATHTQTPCMASQTNCLAKFKLVDGLLFCCLKSIVVVPCLFFFCFFGVVVVVVVVRFGFKVYFIIFAIQLNGL